MKKFLLVLVATMVLCGTAMAQHFTSAILFQNRPSFNPTRAGYFWRDGDTLSFRTSVDTTYIVTTTTPGGVLDLGSLADVDLTTVANGALLRYDAGTGDWYPIIASPGIPDPLIITNIQVDGITNKAGTGATSFPNSLYIVGAGTNPFGSTSNYPYAVFNRFYHFHGHTAASGRAYGAGWGGLGFDSDDNKFYLRQSSVPAAMVLLGVQADTISDFLGTGPPDLTYGARTLASIYPNLNETISLGTTSLSWLDVVTRKLTHKQNAGAAAFDYGANRGGLALSNDGYHYLRYQAAAGKLRLAEIGADTFKDLAGTGAPDFPNGLTSEGETVITSVSGAGIFVTTATAQNITGSKTFQVTQYARTIQGEAGQVLALKGASGQRLDLIDGGSRVKLRLFDDTAPPEAAYGLIGKAGSSQLVGLRGEDNATTGATGVNARMRGTTGAGMALDAEMSGVTLTGNITGPMARVYRSITLSGNNVIAPMFQINENSGAGNVAVGDLMEIRVAQPYNGGRAHLHFYAPNTITSSDYILRAQIGGVGDAVLIDWDGNVDLGGGDLSDVTNVIGTPDFNDGLTAAAASGSTVIDVSGDGTSIGLNSTIDAGSAARLHQSGGTLTTTAAVPLVDILRDSLPGSYAYTAGIVKIEDGLTGANTNAQPTLDLVWDEYHSSGKVMIQFDPDGGTTDLDANDYLFKHKQRSDFYLDFGGNLVLPATITAKEIYGITGSQFFLKAAASQQLQLRFADAYTAVLVPSTRQEVQFPSGITANALAAASTIAVRANANDRSKALLVTAGNPAGGQADNLAEIQVSGKTLTANFNGRLLDLFKSGNTPGAFGFTKAMLRVWDNDAYSANNTGPLADLRWTNAHANNRAMLRFTIPSAQTAAAYFFDVGNDFGSSLTFEADMDGNFETDGDVTVGGQTITDWIYNTNNIDFQCDTAGGRLNFKIESFDIMQVEEDQVIFYEPPAFEGGVKIGSSVTVSGTTTIGIDRTVVRVDASGGNAVISFNGEQGSWWRVQVNDNPGGNTITLKRPTGNINGQATYTGLTTQYQAVDVYETGGELRVISAYDPPGAPLSQTFSFIDAAAGTGLSIRDSSLTTQIYISSIPSFPNGTTVEASLWTGSIRAIPGHPVAGDWIYMEVPVGNNGVYMYQGEAFDQDIAWFSNGSFANELFDDLDMNDFNIYSVDRMACTSMDAGSAVKTNTYVPGLAGFGNVNHYIKQGQSWNIVEQGTGKAYLACATNALGQINLGNSATIGYVNVLANQIARMTGLVELELNSVSGIIDVNTPEVDMDGKLYLGGATNQGIFHKDGGVNVVRVGSGLLFDSDGVSMTSTMQEGHKLRVRINNDYSGANAVSIDKTDGGVDTSARGLIINFQQLGVGEPLYILHNQNGTMGNTVYVERDDPAATTVTNKAAIYSKITGAVAGGSNVAAVFAESTGAAVAPAIRAKNSVASGLALWVEDGDVVIDAGDLTMGGDLVMEDLASIYSFGANDYYIEGPLSIRFSGLTTAIRVDSTDVTFAAGNGARIEDFKRISDGFLYMEYNTSVNRLQFKTNVQVESSMYMNPNATIYFQTTATDTPYIWVAADFDSGWYTGGASAKESYYQIDGTAIIDLTLTGVEIPNDLTMTGGDLSFDNGYQYVQTWTSGSTYMVQLAGSGTYNGRFIDLSQTNAVATQPALRVQGNHDGNCIAALSSGDNTFNSAAIYALASNAAVPAIFVQNSAGGTNKPAILIGSGNLVVDTFIDVLSWGDAALITPPSGYGRFAADDDGSETGEIEPFFINDQGTKFSLKRTPPTSYIHDFQIETSIANPLTAVVLGRGIARDSTDSATMTTDTTIELDLTASGLNGLDEGTEQSSTWYYVWIIHNPTTSVTQGLISTSYDDVAGPNNPPSGYTKWLRVGTFRNDASGNIIPFRQSGTQHSRTYILMSPFTSRNVLTGGGAQTSTQVDCSAFIPPTSSTGDLFVTNNSGTRIVTFQAASGGTSILEIAQGPVSYSNAPLDTTQSFWYLNDASGGDVDAWVRGWKETL